MSAAQDLRRLQEVDTRIAQVSAELAQAESLLRRDPDLERVREAAAAAAAERQSVEQTAAGSEAEVNALHARITSLDRRLYGGSVHNPQDLLDMQRELEALRARLSAAEDRALAHLADAEAATTIERERLEALRNAEARRVADVVPLEARLMQQRADLDRSRAERDRIASGLDPAALELYRRVAQHRIPAVVALDGDACGGCHLPLSTEERRLVRTGTRIVQCSSCDRILTP